MEEVSEDEILRLKDGLHRKLLLLGRLIREDRNKPALSDGQLHLLKEQRKLVNQAHNEVQQLKPGREDYRKYLELLAIHRNY